MVERLRVQDIALCFLALAALFFVKPCSSTDNDLALELLVAQDTVEVERNKVKTLKGALNSIERENEELVKAVAELMAKGETVKYITVTETKLVPAEPVNVFPEIPEKYEHKLGSTVVGDFTSIEGKPPYTFRTYELSFRNNIVLSKKSVVSTIEVSSSQNPGSWEEVEATVNSTRVNDHSFLDPQLGIGLTYGFPNKAYGSIYFSGIHPHPNVDVLNLRLSAGESAAAGVDLVGYNVGSVLPVVNDLWVYGGLQLDTAGVSTVGLTVGTKL
jgi:hypothetical protein